MRKTALAGTTVLALAFLLSACGAAQSTTPAAASTSASSAAASSSALPPASAASADRMGAFKGLNEKRVSGNVKVTATDIELSDFSSDEGPDLHVYLTNGTDEAAVSAGKEISKIDFKKGIQSFSLKDIKAEGYSTVVIHCDKAKAVFGAAVLAS